MPNTLVYTFQSENTLKRTIRSETSRIFQGVLVTDTRALCFSRLRDKLSVLKAKSKRTQARIKAVNTEYDENLHTARARSRRVLVYCQLLFSW